MVCLQCLYIIYDNQRGIGTTFVKFLIICRPNRSSESPQDRHHVFPQMNIEIHMEMHVRARDGINVTLSSASFHMVTGGKPQLKAM